MLEIWIVLVGIAPFREFYFIHPLRFTNLLAFLSNMILLPDVIDGITASSAMPVP